MATIEDTVEESLATASAEESRDYTGEDHVNYRPITKYWIGLWLCFKYSKVPLMNIGELPLWQDLGGEVSEQMEDRAMLTEDVRTQRTTSGSAENRKTVRHSGMLPQGVLLYSPPMV